jgi:hypothetical protein
MELATRPTGNVFFDRNAIQLLEYTMKIHPASSAFRVLTESAESLCDIFGIGASAMEDLTPEADARNLRHDLEQIGGDFRRVMSEIESGTFSE